VSNLIIFIIKMGKKIKRKKNYGQKETTTKEAIKKAGSPPKK